MKNLLGILVLGFLIVSSASWGETKDRYEIEGMSVEDNLLDYFSLETIEKGRPYKYESNKFVGVDIYLESSEIYEIVQIHYKKQTSTQYIIGSISGGIFFENIKDCYRKMEEIVTDISQSFNDLKKKDKGTWKHPADRTGNSTVKSIEFYAQSNEIIIQCTDWSKKMETTENIGDNLRVEIATKEFSDFLINEAY